MRTRYRYYKIKTYGCPSCPPPKTMFTLVKGKKGYISPDGAGEGQESIEFGEVGQEVPYVCAHGKIGRLIVLDARGFECYPYGAARADAVKEMGGG